MSGRGSGHRAAMAVTGHAAMRVTAVAGDDRASSAAMTAGEAGHDRRGPISPPSPPPLGGVMGGVGDDEVARRGCR
jgi:hypothetical protein